MVPASHQHLQGPGSAGTGQGRAAGGTGPALLSQEIWVTCSAGNANPWRSREAGLRFRMIPWRAGCQPGAPPGVREASRAGETG